ncbi:MAG: hypothetical protein AAFV19_07185 [Pseudomonadota bacterium]
MDDLFWFIGIGLYLCAYGAVQFGFISGSRLCFVLLNLAAASAVLVSLCKQFDVTIAVLQIAWIVLSLIGIARIASRCLAHHAQGDH